MNPITDHCDEYETENTVEQLTEAARADLPAVVEYLAKVRAVVESRAALIAEGVKTDRHGLPIGWQEIPAAPKLANGDLTVKESNSAYWSETVYVDWDLEIGDDSIRMLAGWRMSTHANHTSGQTGDEIPAWMA